jgi:hypothetical protein
LKKKRETQGLEKGNGVIETFSRNKGPRSGKRDCGDLAKVGGVAEK